MGYVLYSVLCTMYIVQCTYRFTADSHNKINQRTKREWTKDSVKFQYIRYGTGRNVGIRYRYQRHIKRDRRPSTAACPACCAMRTKELK